MENVTLPVLSFELAEKSGQIFTCTITSRRRNYIQNHAYRYTREKVRFATVNFNTVFASKEIQAESLHTPEKNKTFRQGLYKILLIRGVNAAYHNHFLLISLLMELGKHPISSRGSDWCSHVNLDRMAQWLLLTPPSFVSRSILPLRQRYQTKHLHLAAAADLQINLNCH